MNSQISTAWLQEISKKQTPDGSEQKSDHHYKPKSFEPIWVIESSVASESSTPMYDEETVARIVQAQIEQAEQKAYNLGLEEGKNRAYSEFDHLRAEHQKLAEQLQQQLDKKLAIIEAHHMHYWLTSATEFSLKLIEHLFKEKTSQATFWLAALEQLAQQYPPPTPILYVHASTDVYRLIEPHVKTSDKLMLVEKKELAPGTLGVESNEGGYLFEISSLLDRVLTFTREHSIK